MSWDLIQNQKRMRKKIPIMEHQGCQNKILDPWLCRASSYFRPQTLQNINEDAGIFAECLSSGEF